MLQLKSKHTLYNLCSLHNTQKHPDCSVLILVGDDDEGCLVDIVVILVVGAKSHDGSKAKTVRKENLKYHQPSVYEAIMMRIVFEL